MDVGQLSAVEETALLTVYARALDARRPTPILGDTLAAQVVAAISYDFAGLGVIGSTERFVALRARMLDDRIRAFVDRHPEAVVVDLGAGLSSAVWRVDPPPGVDWYSVDLPAVVALRSALLPARAHAHDVAASLAGRQWCAAMPADRPVILVADGLFAFLDEPVLAALFGVIAGHWRSGVLAFYDYGRVTRASRALGRLAAPSRRMGRLLADTWRFDGFRDPGYPRRWLPGLRLVEETSAMSEPEMAAFGASWRLLARLAPRVPAIAAKARVLTYRF